VLGQTDQPFQLSSSHLEVEKSEETHIFFLYMLTRRGKINQYQLETELHNFANVVFCGIITPIVSPFYAFGPYLSALIYLPCPLT
jgi:hypothetical protein